MKAADKLQCPYNKCIVLEDSEAGVTAAYKAGMLPIVVPDMKEPGGEILELTFKRINSLEDVKEFLEAALNRACSA